MMEGYRGVRNTYQQPTKLTPSPPPAPCVKHSTSWGSTRTIASPFILYNMTTTLPIFLALMWGRQTPALILFPMKREGERHDNLSRTILELRGRQRRSGERRSNSPNKNQRHSMSCSPVMAFRVLIAFTQQDFHCGEQYMICSRFLLLALGWS
ncbi:uncharacterized protein LACBIDRAFT_299042 [Laccaria bicolor S238N-H82]|uniref:Predicted protein n=1 Tax=Laccaria bicolor (strain S238N-H82 / ATCC MYA-4686) TaxID=486041 RepID=B0DDX0_LACBS|nr:uncharacterized protein LACBIDRAFT_299042 [Laccaria bicolor S238N-H82]EDR07159.1 predicted protein [Laccaria bicolor S238N-H82]|eukprot:XP_001882090.1 predicted protein [Laccaria bicolor S238N-H82]